MTGTPDAGNRPELTVVIPVRNGERFIEQAIRSVLAQLGDGDELLIVDDGSTDRTAALAVAIGDARTRIIASEAKGVSAARNLGLAAARGEYLAFLDHDDVWPPGRHQKLAQALRDNPVAGVAYGRIRVRAEADATQPGRGARLDGQHLPTQMGASLFRTAAVRAVGGFCEELRIGEDIDLHHRLTEAGVIAIRCECEALIYRMHGSNVTNDDAAVRQALIEVARRRLSRAQRARVQSHVEAQSGSE